jgi:hypothetical protein
MQIALAQPSKDTFSSVLADFQSKFSLNWAEIDNNFKRKISAAESLMLQYSIKELKDMTDFISTVVFSLDVASSKPKRNSKTHLALWVSNVLLEIRELVDIETTACSQKREEKIAFYKTVAHLPRLNWVSGNAQQRKASKNFSPTQSDKGSEAIAQPENSPDSTSGLIISFGKTDAANSHCVSAEIEVLDPQIYTISIVAADGSFSEERVKRLPPYLIDRKGKLLKKMWHRNYDASYSEIVSEYLSNIAVERGLVVRLMAENLEVSQVCIRGNPPPFLVDERRGVYKRDCVKFDWGVRYFQVISEHLSNIIVV